MTTAQHRSWPIRHSWRFMALGTWWQIDSSSPLGPQLQTTITRLCDDYDRLWSRFRADSLVATIAAAEHGGSFTFPERDIRLFEIYDQLSAATHGGINPLVGRSLEQLGYDAQYSLTPHGSGDDDHAEGNADDTAHGTPAANTERLAPESWKQAVHRDGNQITTDHPVLIDIGAAGKGHLVDLVSHELADAGIDEFLVDGSGDLRHHGTGPVTAALEHPTLDGRALGVVPLVEGALCASATTRHAWGKGLHHMLDGRTGQPVTRVLASWVLAPDAATADGLATALFVADPADLSGFDASWVRMLTDATMQWSHDFHGELFLDERSQSSSTTSPPRPTGHALA